MGTLCKTVAAATTRRWPAAWLLLCFLTYLAAAQTAVGPSASVKPLYACSMQIADLPQFSGQPTPEMLAGNVGLSMGLQGLLSDCPEDSCNDLGGSYGSYTDDGYVQQTSGAIGAVGAVNAAQDPATSRHGRRQQRPPRNTNSHVMQQQQQRYAAASNGAAGAAPSVKVDGLGVKVVSRQGADGPAARAYKYRIASLGAAAAAGDMSVGAARVGVASVGAARGNTTHETLPANSTADAAVSSNSSSNSSGNSSSSSSNSSTAEAPEVWSHGLSGRAAHRRQQQQQQQQKQQVLTKASRHLLADAGMLAGDDSWMDELFGAETDDAYDAQADAYVEKQFCGKGTWMASLSSQQGFTPVAALVSSSSSTAAGLATVSAAAVNSTVGISGHKHRKHHMPDVQTVKGDLYGPAQAMAKGKPHRRTGFKPVWGEDGLWMSESGVAPADATVAAGPRHVMHIVNGLVKITTVDPMHGVPTGTDGYGYDPSPDAVIVTLPDFFGLVASSCDGGYITPSAAYDKEADRFIVTAVCGGDANQILLAVSQCDDATAGWWLYSFPGYVTYDTAMACTDGHNHYTPTSIHTQVGYNKDGVYISFVQNCPICEVPKATGSVLFALPKWALYCGSTHAVVGPVYTGMSVFHALGQFNDKDFSPASFRQLQPVQPQRAMDVQADIAYFVNDPISISNPHQRTKLTTIGLINTGSLWQYSCEDDPAPVLVARVSGRGVDCGTDADTKLLQPQVHGHGSHPLPGQCPSLDAGATHPQGFWTGGAALFANQIYLTDRGPDLRPKGDKHGPLFPTVYWAVLSPSLCATGTCAAFMGKDWGYDQGWDWTMCSWHDNEHPKQQQQKFFRLRPRGKAGESRTAEVGKSKADPLMQFLQAVASKGRQLLESGSAAAVAPAAADTASGAGSTAEIANVAAVALAERQRQQDEGAVGVAGADDVEQAGRMRKHKQKAATSSSSSSSSGTEGGPADSSAPPPYDAPGVRHATAKSGASARRSPFLPAPSSTDDESSDGLYDIDYENDAETADEDSASPSTVQASKPSSGKATDSSSSGKTAAPNAARTKPSSQAAPLQSKQNVAQRQPSTTKGKSAAPMPSMSIFGVADDTDESALVLSVEDLDKLNGLDITDADVEGIHDQGKAAKQGGAPQLKPQQQQQQQQKPAQKPVSPLTPPTNHPPKDTPKLPAQQAPAPAKNPATPGHAAKPKPLPMPKTLPFVPIPAPAPRASNRPPQPAQATPMAGKVSSGSTGNALSYLSKPLAKAQGHSDYAPELYVGGDSYKPHTKEGGYVLDGESSHGNSNGLGPKGHINNGGAGQPAYDWPERARPRAPKPFRHPNMDHQSYGNSPEFAVTREYALPYEHQGPYEGYERHQEQHMPEPRHQQGKGHKHEKKKVVVPSKIEMAKKSVWELMLQAADRAPTSPASHQEYYELWRDYPTVRRVYGKLNIDTCYNPCKYSRNWHRDTKITFGVLVSRRGVVDTVTQSGGNPLGLAFPQVVVREGSALVVYSYSGPHQVPGEGCLAYPGVGYSVIPPGQAMGSPTFNLLQKGDSCIYQGPLPGSEQQAWGSYSGADLHFPSGVAYTAVQYATRHGSLHTQPSNAGTWLQAFAPAKAGWRKAHHRSPPRPSYMTPFYPPPAYGGQDPDYGNGADDSSGGYGSSSGSIGYDDPEYDSGSSGYSRGDPGYGNPGYGGSSGSSSGGYGGSSGSSSGYGGSSGSSSGYGGSSGTYGSSSGDSSAYEGTSGSSSGYGGSSSGNGGSSGSAAYGGGSSGSNAGYSSGGSSSEYSSSGSTSGYGSSSSSSSGYGGSSGSSSGYSSSGSGSSSGYGGSSDSSSSYSSSSSSSGGSSGYGGGADLGYNDPGYGDEVQYSEDDNSPDEYYDYPGNGGYDDSTHFATQPHPQPPGWQPPQGSTKPGGGYDGSYESSYVDGPKYLPTEDTPVYDDSSYDNSNSMYPGSEEGTGFDQYKPKHPQQAPQYVNRNPKQKSDWVNAKPYPGGSDLQEEMYHEPAHSGRSSSSGSDSGDYGGGPGYGQHGPHPQPGYAQKPGLGYGQKPGYSHHDIHGGFVLRPGGPVQGGKRYGQKHAGGAHNMAAIDAADAAAETVIGPVGPGTQHANKLQQQFLQMELFEQQQQQEQQQLQQLQQQKAQLAKQQQLLKDQLQAAKQQQQQQFGSGTDSTAQKGAVLPPTGVEGADLAQGLAALGTAASGTIQQLLKGLGMQDATPRQVAKAVKKAQHAERHSAAVMSPSEPASAEAAVQYFEDYDLVEGQTAAATAAPADGTQLSGALVAYLQSLGAKASSRHASAGIAALPAGAADVAAPGQQPAATAAKGM